MICLASSGMSFHGSLSENSNRCAIVWNCLKIQLFFSGPCGANAPFLIESVSSGTIFFSLTTYNSPMPLQFEQAPFGELNEKLLGSGLG